MEVTFTQLTKPSSAKISLLFGLMMCRDSRTEMSLHAIK